MTTRQPDQTSEEQLPQDRQNVTVLQIINMVLYGYLPDEWKEWEWPFVASEFAKFAKHRPVDAQLKNYPYVTATLDEIKLALATKASISPRKPALYLADLTQRFPKAFNQKGA